AQRSIKVKVDSKGQQYAAGMSIGVENTDKGMQSNVIFLADKFMVMNQANGNPVPAFVVKDGNVIMNSAILGKATINFANISDTIQSENYISGKSGWRLFKDGTFEINSSFAEGGRVVINSDGLAVYDERNILRVLLGKLWR
ncbi:phage tail tip fiber protein, partial [Frischella perrara]|uniref:phage tail tip fiber protein n=1 Tax=Frischella perrara TaxID=1267021 RepID=UPI0023F34565